jgi:hypothetical protein
MPPIFHSSPATVTVLATVSVVMIARAASRPPVRLRALATVDMPSCSGAGSRGMPMRPVEHTSTCWGDGAPIAAAVTAAISSATATSVPVAQLALPLLRTTALA